MKRESLLVGLLLMLLSPLAPASTQVFLRGAVAQPGAMTLEKDHARLSDAALAAKPLAGAYMLGAAWLRPSLQVPQQRLKAGVLFDLAKLRKHDKPRVAALAGRLYGWLAGLPVTGRRIALLDARVVEANAMENHPLADGDTLYYPLRPANIRIVGAVQHACSLPLVALQDARTYLPACPAAEEADADSIYIIEPDGHVFEQGIALWNRSAAHSLAPGAIIYVPLDAGAAATVNPTFNADVASFLATQVLAGLGTP